MGYAAVDKADQDKRAKHASERNVVDVVTGETIAPGLRKAAVFAGGEVGGGGHTAVDAASAGGTAPQDAEARQRDWGKQVEQQQSRMHRAMRSYLKIASFTPAPSTTFSRETWLEESAIVCKAFISAARRLRWRGIRASGPRTKGSRLTPGTGEGLPGG